MFLGLIWIFFCKTLFRLYISLCKVFFIISKRLSEINANIVIFRDLNQEADRLMDLSKELDQF